MMNIWDELCFLESKEECCFAEENPI